MENDNKRDIKSGKGALVVTLAVILVAAATFVPWEKVTGGKIKDFNLVSDLITDTTGTDDDLTAVEDPTGLLAADANEELPDVQPVSGAGKDGTSVTSDSITERPLPQRKPSRQGDITLIEDYSSAGNALARLRQKLASGSLVRIAVVGDSYIEGDIMTQDLRSQLQSKYGGCGVGYMNLHSDFPGFRRSVTQSSNKNWKNYTATKRGKEQYMWLAEQYSNPAGEATATYKGSKSLPGADSWDKARFLFIAPVSTTVSTRVNGGEWTDHVVEGSDQVQMIEVPAHMTEFSVKASSPSLVALGVWLEPLSGVSVDCMSSRGIPGYSLAKISPDLSLQIGNFVNYDLIILEFGVNAMSAKQKNYSVFSRNMVKVIDNLRNCYPEATIMLMGVGDRGERRSGAVHSMSTITNMIDAQREAAMTGGVLFWDTREAMGGEDAIVEWAKTGKANKDYIHLTHKGGAALATELVKALESDLK